MNQIKTFKVLVIVLAIMNVSLLAIMWFHRPPMDGGPRERPNDMNRFLVHELRLTEAQRQQFDALFDEHQQKMEAVKNRGRELHDLLFDELSNTSSTNKSDSLIGLIGENRKLGEKALYNHLSKVRLLCNEKQKQEFDRIIKGAMARMGERK
jgi:Spy/CpxP family protein refolding chaperone